MKPSVRDPVPPEEDQQDHADFQACLAYVDAHAAGEVEGLFGPESTSWVIFREPAILLGGLAAVLLQLAHPAVASGVGQHSNFRQDIRGRSRRTSTALYRLIFGTLADATDVTRRLYRIHRLVRGRIEAPGLAIDGKAYRANQRELLLWVSSTTAVTSKIAFEHFVRPLTADEARRRYPELLLGSAAVGVRPDFQPPTEEAFDAWYQGMLSGGELRVTPPARSIAEALFRSPFSGGPVGAILTAGLLPQHLREGYGLAWGRWEQRSFRALAASLRRAAATMRPPFRYAVAWHQAELRLAKARGERAPLLGRSLDALGRRLGWLPTSLGATARRTGVAAPAA